MLQYKSPYVYLISGTMLGWFDGPAWRPSCVIVGSEYNEAELSKWLKLEVRDRGLYQFGKRLATVEVGPDGKISNLTLDAQ